MDISPEDFENLVKSLERRVKPRNVYHRDAPAGFSEDERISVKFALKIIPWIVAFMATLCVPVGGIIYVEILDHKTVADTSGSVKEMQHALNDATNKIDQYGRLINNLERRIAYTNKVDHPKTLPNGDEGFE